ncbi:MAG: hypothetical protein OHK0012_16660 [Synechococcales cyanobacterium]
MKRVFQSILAMALASSVVACSSAPNTVAFPPTGLDSPSVTAVEEDGGTSTEPFDLPHLDLSAEDDVAPETDELLAAYVAPSHLGAAQEIATAILPANTTYQHHPDIVTWAGVNGATTYVSKTDCSGFLTALFAHTYGLTADTFRTWLGQGSPQAKTYYDGIVAKNGFTPIALISRVRPGDIVAMKYLDDSANTGHVMVVAGSPVQRVATSPIIPGTTQWEIPVIDQSNSGHGPTDTRRLPNGTFRSGLGQGVFRVYANSKERIVGYTWSTFANSTYYTRQTRPLAVGRLRPTEIPR